MENRAPHQEYHGAGPGSLQDRHGEPPRSRLLPHQEWRGVYIVCKLCGGFIVAPLYGRFCDCNRPKSRGRENQRDISPEAHRLRSCRRRAGRGI